MTPEVDQPSSPDGATVTRRATRTPSGGWQRERHARTPRCASVESGDANEFRRHVSRLPRLRRTRHIALPRYCAGANRPLLKSNLSRHRDGKAKHDPAAYDRRETRHYGNPIFRREECSIAGHFTGNCLRTERVTKTPARRYVDRY